MECSYPKNIFILFLCLFISWAKKLPFPLKIKFYLNSIAESVDDVSIEYSLKEPFKELAKIKKAMWVRHGFFTVFKSLVPPSGRLSNCGAEIYWLKPRKCGKRQASLLVIYLVDETYLLYRFSSLLLEFIRNKQMHYNSPKWYTT